MVGLRAKILIGFGGLLAILIAISVLGEGVLDRYSASMQRSFREDYDSVAVCQQMKESVERINSVIEAALLGRAPAAGATAELERSFDTNLLKQRVDATLAGEKQATDRLAALWDQYRHRYPDALDPDRASEERRTIYSNTVFPLSQDVESSAQYLIDLNMQSVLSVHGKAREMADRANSVMHVLSISGVAMAIVFALLIGRFVLAPLRLLTASARQIEAGNLDLQVPVRSRDELGALATAFNAMAAQLRAYRQREHDRLVRTEHSTQLTIDSLPDAVVILNPAGRVELANEAARRLFQIAPGNTIDADGKTGLAELHRRSLQSGQSAELEGYDTTIQLEVDGELRHFLPRSVPILDETQRVIGSTLILADVTGLRRLDEMKNGLLSLVSHELKTPLTSMRMILHLLAEEKVGPLAPRQRELLTTTREDSDRLHQIVESLLDMGRIESGKALMDLRPVPPDRLVSDAAAALRAAFESQQTSLQTDIPPTLPPVLADETRVGYVIANLLANALRHTAAGGRVCVHAQAADRVVEFSVEDDGAGIPPQYVHRVFEKFFRVPGQPGNSGSGLGLAIAKEIVEAHGGHIRVRRSTRAGTTFAFTLRRSDIQANGHE